MANAASFRGFTGLCEVVPRPGHKPSGEERAWGRRLAKRFGVDGQLDDRVFVVRGDASPSGMLDYTPRKAPALAATLAELFTPLEGSRRDTLVAFGWAMAEDLAAGSLPK
jgi:hypothetical protein